ncbi:MAG: metal ABC transporter ATP-binding protein [Boseongicola sp.]|nr:metal ABC transporter ATP-binding protein [Boseongicola sp.]NNJ69533.1 metal ABC transporter ATP-binding protein [Boseongicola sp.]
MSPLFQAKGMSVRLDGQVVLASVNLSVSPGEIVTIVGPNGSGKSTLLRAIIGAIQPDSGSLDLRPGLRIGYVPQKLHIDPTLPVTVIRFLSLPKAASRSEALRVLGLTGAQSVAARQLSELSGGQLQRVLLARALLAEPELLILDEATQGLDQPGSASFYQLISDIRDDIGCGILMVSHELHVVMASSDRVICLNGHICCEGHPAHVASAPEYRALFGTGTGGALALYRHEHDHNHDHHHEIAE